MLTEKELRRLQREERKYAREPPSAAEILKLAKKFKLACAALNKVYGENAKVHGLDQWDEKHMAWERKLFCAENAKDLAKEVLLCAARAIRM